MEIIEAHFQDAFRDGNARGFLHRLCIVLKEKPGEQECCARGNEPPGECFEQVADSGFFRVGHLMIVGCVFF